MKLIRTSFFSAVITFIKIASGFVVGKVVAIFTGAAGVAVIGSFTNLVTIVLTFANGAINNGVVKYTAEYNDDEIKLKSLFSTSLKISVYCSVTAGILVCVFASQLSKLVLSSNQFKGPIMALGITMVFYSLNSLLVSVLNGKSKINTYTIVNAAGSIFGLLFTIVLIYFYNIKGALYALILSQSIVFFITVALISKSDWFSWLYFKEKFNTSIAVKLSHYSFMAIVTALTVPLSQIVLRKMLTSKFGIDAAGYWQGLMRISDGYLMLITTSLSVYYLPKFSYLKTKKQIQDEIFNGYKIILPIVLAGCVSIYFLRTLIIKILYTSDFSVMENLFLWQLIGDFFKIAAWMLAYLMLAKAMIRTYIVTEILSVCVYVIGTVFFVEKFGLKGITIAFAVNYIIYFITM
ncbi:MAG: O-antigen translocase, partial [Flavobacteriales bacterium]